MTKLTYKDATNKKKVRKHLFSLFNGKVDKLIGLAGPDIKEYTKFVESFGIKDIEVWENDPYVMSIQIPELPELSVEYHVGNILNSERDRRRTLYDLDFCCTIGAVKEEIANFKSNFIMTFSQRSYGVEETLR
jgi:hypothetical protein